MGKKAPYMIFAFKQRKRFERELNRKIDDPELIKLASPEWKLLTDREKDLYKDEAMRTRETSSGSETFKNETSNHRLDTEGITISCVEIENRRNRKKKHLMKQTDQLDMKQLNLHYLDVQYYVNRKDGTFVPAEMAIMPLNSSVEGARAVDAAESWIVSAEKSSYTNFANEALNLAPKRHGINLLDLGSYAITLVELREKLSRKIDEKAVFLVQAEKFFETVGVLFFLKLTDVHVTTIESYVNKVTANRYSPTQIGGLLCSSRFDHIQSMRCNYHREKSEAMDKTNCSLKNVLKFARLVPDLTDMDNPPGDLTGNGYTPDNQSAGALAANVTNSTATSKHRTGLEEVFGELAFQEEPTPRRPHGKQKKEGNPDNIKQCPAPNSGGPATISRGRGSRTSPPPPAAYPTMSHDQYPTVNPTLTGPGPHYSDMDSLGPQYPAFTGPGHIQYSIGSQPKINGFGTSAVVHQMYHSSTDSTSPTGSWGSSDSQPIRSLGRGRGRRSPTGM